MRVGNFLSSVIPISFRADLAVDPIAVVAADNVIRPSDPTLSHPTSLPATPSAIVADNNGGPRIYQWANTSRCRAPYSVSHNFSERVAGRPRAHVIINGESRNWVDDARFSASHARYLLGPLLAAEYNVDVTFCLDATSAAKGAATQLLEGALRRSPPSPWSNASTISVHLIELSGDDSSWPQYARLAHCRACASEVADAADVFVVLRPDLLLYDALPAPRSLSREVVHTRVRAAVNVHGLVGAHFSFHFDRSDCWDETLPPAPASAAPWFLPDDALSVFFSGAAAAAVFNAFSANLLHATSNDHEAAAEARGVATPCAVPREYRTGPPEWPEAKLYDSVRCAGVDFAPLAITARIQRHVDYGSPERCYSFEWRETCPSAAGSRLC